MAPSASAELVSLSASELQLSLVIPEGAIASVSSPTHDNRHPTSLDVTLLRVKSRNVLCLLLSSSQNAKVGIS